MYLQSWDGSFVSLAGVDGGGGGTGAPGARFIEGRADGGPQTAGM